MEYFETHLRGAQGSNDDDLRWVIACYIYKMIAMCRDPYNNYMIDEEKFQYLAEVFERCLNKFVIYDDEHSIHKQGVDHENVE